MWLDGEEEQLQLSREEMTVTWTVVVIVKTEADLK
jgi:hypothetical protein